MGVAGFGFLSGVEELTSSVENLQGRKNEGDQQNKKEKASESIVMGLNTHLTDCLRDWRPSGVDTSVG